MPKTPDRDDDEPTPETPKSRSRRDRRLEADDEGEDENVDEGRRPLRRRDEEEDGVVSSIIPYKNGRALISYYCGVFTIIPIVGLILGPTAVILGVLGLKFAGQHPEAKGKAHAIVGIVLGTLFGLLNCACSSISVAAIISGIVQSNK
jgi:hypothetical protein